MIARALMFMALAASAVGCRSAGHLPVARDLGEARDVLGDTGPLPALLAELASPPWELLVGAAADLDALLVARTVHPEATTIVDVSALEPLAREGLGARLVEAALEDGGALLVDETGASVRTLRGDRSGAVLVLLREDRTVASVAPVAGDGEVRP